MICNLNLKEKYGLFLFIIKTRIYIKRRNNNSLLLIDSSFMRAIVLLINSGPCSVHSQAFLYVPKTKRQLFCGQPRATDNLAFIVLFFERFIVLGFAETISLISTNNPMTSSVINDKLHEWNFTFFNYNKSNLSLMNEKECDYWLIISSAKLALQE